MKLQKTTSIAALALLSAGVLGTSTVALAGEKGDTYNSNAVVKFKPDTAPTPPTPPTDPNNPDTENNVVNPWDPTTPNHKPTPGTNGPLSIDFASSFDFGMNLITDKDQTYMAEAQYYFTADGKRDLTKPKENYVQVTDKRGTAAGWTLTVTQSTQLTTVSGKVLDGAEITFADPNVAQNKASVDNVIPAPIANGFTLAPGKAVKVMSAADGYGMYTWINSWGDKDKFVDGVAMDETTAVKRNPSITLSVPGKTMKYAELYKSELVWTISDAPGTTYANPGE